MARRAIKGIGSGVAVVAVIGLVVLANQYGVFGGKARQLLGRASRAAAHDHLPEARAALEELVATYPDSPWVDDGLVQLAEVYEAQGELLEAAATYRMLLERFPESPFASRAQERLGDVNVAVLFSPIVTELDLVYEVKAGDTLGRIAAANGTTVDLIKRANGIGGHLIHPRQKLKVPNGRFRIVVDKSQNQLLLTREDQFVKGYVTATGRNDSTPEGTFTIVNKITDPVWYRQGAVVPPDSPENILGSRWMGWNKKGYGIHGSVDPAPITEQDTAGCVRLSNQDVQELFAIVPIGTEVTVVN